MPLRSALIVSIELPEWLAAIRAGDKPAASPGLPAHVTVLFPFIPVDILDPSVGLALTELCADRAPFRARFNQVQHREAMVWVLPQQQESFLELTKAVVERWPAYLPYDGAFDTVIAHLTLVESGSEAIALATSAALKGGVFEVLVDELQLLGEADIGGWRVLERFRLGSGPTG